MRFTPPGDSTPSDPKVQKALIKAITDEKPAFITLGGDIPYRGAMEAHWREFDQATAPWREKGIAVYPSLGNHELMGGGVKDEHGKYTNLPEDVKNGLENYFRRFPAIKGSNYYSLRAGRVLMLFLDSNPRGIIKNDKGEETEQGKWLSSQLDQARRDTDFVVVVMHHPPYTSSTDGHGEKPVQVGTRMAAYKGHAARPTDHDLGRFLEERQARLKPRIMVLASHVHNYERKVHGNVTYITTGGGGAQPVLIRRQPDDLFKGEGINFHYLSVEVEPGRMQVTMNRLDPDRPGIWTKADTFTLRPLL
ncbi:MAG: hypothetical protein HGA66_08550 [Holophaga sp.]|nr:hypothetical protein [Holophaga sp.]